MTVHLDSTEALMQPWFDAEHGELYGRPTVKGEGIVMGFPVWGKEYIDRFVAYTIPTLMAPENLAALKDRCRLVIWHEAEAKPYLHRLTAWVRRGGIEIIFREIPDNVMELLYRTGPPTMVGNLPIPGNYGARFQALAVVGNVITHMAGRWGMALHLSQPDHLYGQHYFKNLFRLGEKYEAITQMSLNATLVGIAPEVERYRDESGALAFPDRDLGDMAFRHMHPQCQLHSMNAAKIPDKIPLSHRLFWQAKDAVHMYSSHVNAAWLSPRLCLDAPIAFTSTLDTMLPELVPPDVEVYVPPPEDEMTFIEFSDATKPANRPYVSLKEFCTNFWDSSSYSGEYIPYFIRPTLVPIKPKASYLTDDEIKRQFATLLQAAMDSQDEVGIAWLKKRFSSRYTRAAALPELMR